MQATIRTDKGQHQTMRLYAASKVPHTPPSQPPEQPGEVPHDLHSLYDIESDVERMAEV